MAVVLFPKGHSHEVLSHSTPLCHIFEDVATSVTRHIADLDAQAGTWGWEGGELQSLAHFPHSCLRFLWLSPSSTGWVAFSEQKFIWFTALEAQK